jgi:hypothetical protein
MALFTYNTVSPAAGPNYARNGYIYHARGTKPTNAHVSFSTSLSLSLFRSLNT